MKKYLSLFVALTLIASMLCAMPLSVLAANVVVEELPSIDTSITFDDVYDTVSDGNGGYINSWSMGKSQKQTFSDSMLVFTSMTNSSADDAIYELVKESSGNVYLKMTGYNQQLRVCPDDPSTPDNEYYGGRQILNFRVKMSNLKANLLVLPYFVKKDGTQQPMNLNFMNTKKINFNAVYGVSDTQNNQEFAFDVWYNVVMMMDFEKGVLIFNAYNESKNTRITAISDISAYSGISEVRFQNQAKATGGTILIDNISFIKDELPEIDRDITFDDMYNTVSDGNGGYQNLWTLGKSARYDFPGSMLVFTSMTNADDNVANFEFVKENGNAYLKMTGYNQMLRNYFGNSLTRDTDYYGKKITVAYKFKVSNLKGNLLVLPYLIKNDGTKVPSNLNFMTTKKVNFNAAYGVSDSENNQTFAYDDWYDVKMVFDFNAGKFTFSAVNMNNGGKISASSDISEYFGLGDEIRFQNQGKADGGVICIDDMKVIQEKLIKDKFIYSITDDGNAIIYGCTDKLTQEEQKNLVIPEKLEGKYPVIEVGGFRDNKTIQTLTLPKSLVTVADEAFWGCSSLTDVVMPSAESLGYRSFYACSKLVRMNSDYYGEVVLPENLRVLGNHAFRTANSVKTLIIPESVSEMGAAFGNTSGIRNIYFPDSIDKNTYANGFVGGFANYKTVNAYGSSNSYIKTYCETAIDSQSGNKVYNFIEENGDIICFDAEYTNGAGVPLRGTSKDALDGTKAVGFTARLFNTSSDDVSATAIISIVNSTGQLKSVGTYPVSISSWSGITLSGGDLVAENISLETGDKIKVMFWDDMASIRPATTRSLEYTADLTDDEILVMAIGNSYSQDSITYIDEIAAANGVNISAYTCYVGGRPLIHHYDAIMNADDESNPRRLYMMRSGSEDLIETTATDMLKMYDWDYVTLQGASHPNANDQILWYDTYDYTKGGLGSGNSSDAVSEIAEVVAELAPNAKRAFVAPWATSNSFAETALGGKFANGAPDARGAMTSELLARQNVLADVYSEDSMVMPTAVAVDYLIRHFGFPEFEGTADSSGNYSNTSTARGVYRDTTCHLTNNVGRVLAGLVWYEMITGTPATENAYTRSTLSADDMAKIKEAAHYACENYKTYDPLAVEPAEGSGEIIEISLADAQNLIAAYPDGKLKAFTARYDDGRTGDRELVDIFNDNGIKGTFYLIPRFLTGTNYDFVKLDEVKPLYLDAGHEIANHSYWHYVPGDITEEEFIADIQKGYDYLDDINPGKIKGFGYPSSQYGRDKAATIKALEEMGHTYAVGGLSTNSFDLPDMSKPYEISATMRHADANYDFIDVASEFVALNPTSQKLFFLFGHSFELEDDYETTGVKKSFDDMRTFAETIGGKDDIWYATNCEIFEYLIAQNKIGNFENPGYYQNNSQYSICYLNGDSLVTLNPGDILKIN